MHDRCCHMPRYPGAKNSCAHVILCMYSMHNYIAYAVGNHTLHIMQACKQIKLQIISAGELCSKAYID